MFTLLARHQPRYCDVSGLLREGFCTISPAKMNGFKPNLAERNYVSNWNPQEHFGAISMRGALRDFFVCLYVASPFDPLQTEKTADFGVESRDPTANLRPWSKIPDFLRVGGGGSKKWDFRSFGVGVKMCSPHRTSDLHAKSMDY